MSGNAVSEYNAAGRKTRAQAEQYLAACMEYTNEYEHEKLVRDWMDKPRVARNIVGDFERRAGPVKDKKLLDIGFGSGHLAAAFMEAGAIVSGLEVNPVLFEIGKENSSADLHLYDGGVFPFPDASFDYAFSTSVLEHVSDPQLFLCEAARVLRKSGKFYIAFPNRLAPRETHTGIWGLSYLPRPLARSILKAFGRNTLEEINLHFIGYWRMKRLARKAGLIVLYEDGRTGLRSLIKRSLASLGIHHSAILRTVMVVLEKPI